MKNLKSILFIIALLIFGNANAQQSPLPSASNQIVLDAASGTYSSAKLVNRTLQNISPTGRAGYTFISAGADTAYIGIDSAGFMMLYNSNSHIVVVDTSGAGYGSASPSALFEIKSTEKGILFPKMTTTQRNAISSPAFGLIIFNTSDTLPQFYNGSAWVDMTGQ